MLVFILSERERHKLSSMYFFSFALRGEGKYCTVVILNLQSHFREVWESFPFLIPYFFIFCVNFFVLSFSLLCWKTIFYNFNVDTYICHLFSMLNLFYSSGPRIREARKTSLKYLASSVFSIISDFPGQLFEILISSNSSRFVHSFKWTVFKNLLNPFFKLSFFICK